jgi:hypothetical protein
METILGTDNNLFDYLLVLLTYAGLFVAMRQSSPRVEPEFRKSFIVLFVVWSVGIFASNYLLSQLGIMSFLPWLNNFIHSFIWIGLCLTFLYAVSYKKPLWEQLVLFAIYSFVVKLAEHQLLGTWEFDRFFFIDGNLAYIIGWSLVDGLFPVGSAIVLWIAARFMTGIVKPELNLLQAETDNQ